MKRNTKRQHFKDLREKNRLRAIRGWRVRHLRMQANPREETFEEIIERAKRDRKGKKYATFERDGLKLILFYSLNRSDQFDVKLIMPSKYDGSPDIEKMHLNLSMPKVMQLFKDGK